jgi:membrane-associated protein
MIEFINSRWARVVLVIVALFFMVAFFFGQYLVGFFLSYLLLYRYITLFIIVGLAGFCIPIPMNILLMAVGALSLTGEFDLITSVGIAASANLLGDLAALYIFRHFGHRILHDQFAEKYSFFVKLEEFFKRNINLSIFISRIVGIFGTPVNFLSGYLKISVTRFVIFDFLGNFAYATIFLKIGATVGDKWLSVSEFVNTAMNVVAVVILFSVLALLWKTNVQKSA